MQAPVPMNYPFMHPDDIALTQPEHGPEFTTNTTHRRTWRARR